MTIRKLTPEEIKVGAQAFRESKRSPLQDAAEETLGLEYVVDDAGGEEIVVRARLKDGDGRSWEGTARGRSEEDLKREAFEDLRTVLRRTPRSDRVARRLAMDVECPSVALQRRQRKVTYSTELTPELRVTATITDDGGREWKATAPEMVDAYWAVLDQLEKAARRDEHARKLLGVIEGPPQRRRKRSGPAQGSL